ncbi:MAG TPA: thioredoxin family protein [Thermoanaerobaculia bacterium]|nr:thioredoxin family protein [Thermoanaerobaculia bacterium]
MKHATRNIPRALAALLAAAVLAAPAVSAQEADTVLRDFLATGDYVLKVDGQVQPSAQVYLSDRVPGILLVASALPEPTLLLPREGTVNTVSFMKLLKRGDGSIDLLADTEVVPKGRFRLEGQAVHFAVAGASASLEPRPYLLGRQSLSSMLGYSPEYRRKADAYRPDATALATLKSTAKPVRVRVYFGSWCPHCKEHVPYLLKVAEQLRGSKVSFEFYGLPQGFGNEPMAKKDDVNSVPTAIVYVDGKEAGRVGSGDWVKPERRIRDILASS